MLQTFISQSFAADTFTALYGENLSVAPRAYDFLLGGRFAPTKDGHLSNLGFALTLTDSSLVGDPALTLDIDGFDLSIGCAEDLTHQFIQGTFTLVIDGWETGEIAYNATAADIQLLIDTHYGPSGRGVSGGPLPFETITFTGLSTLAEGSNSLTTAFIAFEPVPVPTLGCGPCAYYCPLCFRDIPAGAFELIVSGAKMPVTIDVWFIWQYYLPNNQIYPEPIEDATWWLHVNGVDTEITYNYTGTKDLQEFLVSYGVMFAHYVIVYDAADAIDPASVSVSCGTNCGAVVCVTSPRIGLNCLNDTYVLWHTSYAPGNGCSYEIKGFHITCFDQLWPFANAQIEVLKNTDSGQYEGAGHYVVLDIANIESGSAGTWHHKISEIDDPPVCTNISHTFTALEYTSGQSETIDWTNAAITVESIEYPDEAAPVGGREIFPYVNDKLRRECIECTEDCGDAPNDEIRVQFIDNSTYAPGPLYDSEDNEVDVSVLYLQHLDSAGPGCCDNEGCMYGITFDPPLHDGDDYEYTDFFLRLGQGSGFAGWNLNYPCAAPSSPTHYWTSAPSWEYSYVSPEDGWLHTDLLPPLSCFSDWYEVAESGDLGFPGRRVAGDGEAAWGYLRVSQA